MGGSGIGNPEFGPTTSGRGSRPDSGQGAGAGGGSGDGGGGGGGADECSSLRETISLASPNPDVLRELKEGEILWLELTEKSAPVRAITTEAPRQNVGVVISSSLEKLVDCMRSGNQYEAKIIEIDGGACTVEVRPRK